MAGIVPETRPRLSYGELMARVAPLGFDAAANPVFVAGIRGYYRDMMGAPHVNDRGIYDDAIFLVSPSFFGAYNGNTDPSRLRRGAGKGAGKGMAKLDPGVWPCYSFALHRGKYTALCQTEGKVTVTRDGSPDYQDTGWFGINIHRGAANSTSSLGCQTIHPDQWEGFIGPAQDQARRYHGAGWKRRALTYVLLEG